MTGLQFHQYKSGKISREQAVEYATKRALTALDKELKKKLEKVDRIANALDFDFIRIDIEFKKSRIWGHCPAVCAYVDRKEFKGYASGCGYDKESAAVAQAINKSDSVLKMLYTLKEKELAASEIRNNIDLCFDYGVGLNSIWEIFKKCGYTVTEHNGYYIIEKM